MDSTPLEVLLIAIYLSTLPGSKRYYLISRSDKVLTTLRKRLRRQRHTPLRRALVLLPSPKENWSDDEWQTFDTVLQEGLQREFNIESFWTLDAENLRRYLEGSLLLLACLEQAAVEDREAIKARLFRPPVR